ncbi:MAG: GNAT family N-acetyltransferase, partial [Anaerostipes caccae]
RHLPTYEKIIRNLVSFCFLEKIQKQGIGRALWNYFLAQSRTEQITVNASPYAVPVYEKLGFQAVDDEQLTDGIRYTPMTLNR